MRKFLLGAVSALGLLFAFAASPALADTVCNATNNGSSLAYAAGLQNGILALLCDSNGYLDVDVKTGAAYSGTAGPQTATASSFTGVGGIYNSSPPTATSGQYVPFQTDASGNMKVNVASGSLALATTSGTGTISTVGATNGVIIPTAGYNYLQVKLVSNSLVGGTITWGGSNDGGVTYPWTGWMADSANYNTVFYETGSDSIGLPVYGYDHVVIYASALTSGTATITWTTANVFTAFRSNLVSPYNDGQGGYLMSPVGGFDQVYNGTNWDRVAKCTKTVQGTISSATTTQLVALSGSQVVHVCDWQVQTVSGTTPAFSFEYGTGTNCATGTSVMTAPLTGAALQVFTSPPVGPGGYVMSNVAGDALCVVSTGTTPSITYTVHYNQY